jgi:phosphonate metabolism-associated iron-containing alcohol dehydrogenase
MFNFHLPTTIVFGNSTLKEIKSYVTGKNVIIVTDSYQETSGFLKELEGLLSDCNIAHYCDVEPNPSVDTVNKAAKIGRNINADTVIGLGGGSCMDVAKAVSVLITNGGNIEDYISGAKSIDIKRVALIAIPTTAGTGSEVTNVGVFTNNETHKKSPLVHKAFWCDYAIVDPELTYSLPPSATASTGLDALCHAIESYWAESSNPMSDALAIYAAKLVLNNLKDAYNNPKDAKARENLAMASLIAGVAFSQTRTTALHAISFRLTSQYGVPHGFACAISLPEFIDICENRVNEKLMILAKSCNFKSIKEFKEAIVTLMKAVKAPMKLCEVGVKENEITKLAEASMSEKIMQNTPGGMEKDVLIKIFEKLV